MREATERIRDTVDLASIVGGYVTLRRSGSNRLVGLCPFHKESTPSFTVSANLFYCHGCHAGGDAFAFIQRIEAVPFLTARKILAERLSIQLDPEAERAPDRRGQKQLAEQLAAEAEWFWHRVRIAYYGRYVFLRRCERQCSVWMDLNPESDWLDALSLRQRCALRAWRWWRIILRLAACEIEVLFHRYLSYRDRHPGIVQAFDAERRMRLDFESSIRNAIRGGA